MKKKYLYLLMFIFLLIIGFLIFNFFNLGKIMVNYDDQICNVDDDCMMAPVKCSCDCGIPINKENLKKYLDKNKNMCKFYVGPMCKMLCEQELKCIDNLCSVV